MCGSKLRIWFTAVVFCLVASVSSGVNAADHPKGLNNESCLSCHGGKNAKIEVAGADGEKRELYTVLPGVFAKSVHADMECVNCHLEINDSTAKHQKTPGEKRPDCVQCHQKMSDTASQQKVASQRSWMRNVGEYIENYKTSHHAKPDPNDPTKPNASCNDCHNVHSFNVPPHGTRERTAWHLGISDLCGKCHEDQLATWSESAHGKEIKQKHNANAADCADCHTTHNVKKTASKTTKLEITANCGSCHEDAYKSYKATYHGQVTTLGYAHTAKCYNCHGSHEILPSKDPKSMMHLDNRLETCQSCHSGSKGIPKATAGFVSFSPHGTTSDFSTYPQLWIGNKIMIQLLVGTFGFFWLHTLLWFYREYKERKQRGSQPHVKMEGLSPVPAQFQGKHFRRFSRTWRIAHLTFALSLMVLTLTGIPLFYPESPWAQPLMTLLNGPQTAGWVHRVAAVVFAGVFFWHLIYMGVGIGRDWKNFKIFGPNSMVPGLQDLKDIIAMFKWFFGKAPRPVFDRWTYWEKFDYWAPFWGVTIIGVSGLLMWFPHIAAKFLPGWVFNVAAIFHSEEAFLAVVFLFTVHFFNNHFRPDKFPLDRVMFTGTFTLDELMHEHPLQYQRLLESGELEQHLVEAPSSIKVAGSTVLGFTLIVLGLTLLTLVGIGFFTSF